MEKYNIKSLKYSNEPNKELLQKTIKIASKQSILFSSGIFGLSTVHLQPHSLSVPFFSFGWQRVTSGLSENQDT